MAKENQSKTLPSVPVVRHRLAGGKVRLEMKYFDLPDAQGRPIRISKIIMGGAPLGTGVSRDLSFQMLDRFFERGGNTIDTARVYCEWLENGASVSERTIGEWVKSRGCREKAVIVTKGGHPHFPDLSVPRLSRAEIYGDIDTSLKTLQMDYVDLYLLHRDDVSRPVGDIMDTLHSLVKQGKTRAVGVSNWSAERILKANRYAAEHRQTAISVSEIQWSLAECFPETYGDKTLVCMTDAEYRQYLQMGMPVFAFSSQAGGIFSKISARGIENIGGGSQKFLTPENIRRYRNLERFCKEKGYGETAVSLCYITDNRLPAGAIIGCRTMRQLEDSLSSADIRLSCDDADGLIRKERQEGN